VKVVEVDFTKHYLRAEAPSSFPSRNVDDLEFVLEPKEGLVFYRAASRESVYLYPLQQPVSDGGNLRKRVDSLQRTLGWGTLIEYTSSQ
jgi:uncharacterized protein (DUF1499 family)